MIDIVPFYGMMMRRRLITICIVFTIFFLLYSAPSMFRFVRRKAPFIMDSSLNAMLRHIEEIERDAGAFNAQLQRSYDSEDVPLTPFVGNGYIAFNEAADELFFFGEPGRLLSTALPFSPLVNVEVENRADHGHVTRALHFVHGKLIKIETYMLASSKTPITIRQEILAHRSDPSVFLQSLEMTLEDSWKSARVSLQQRAKNFPPAVKVKNLGVHNGLHYVQLNGKVAAGHKFIVYSVIMPQMDIKLSFDSKSSYDFFTIVKYSKPVSMAEVVASESKVNDLSRKDFDRVMASMKKVEAEHVNSWLEIWRSGLSISLSRAENALNGDRINATLYYVLSHTPESTSLDLPALGKHCYKGHHTLNARTLWPPLADLGKVSVLEQTVQLWQLTLFKRGCGELLSHGGPNGAMQAMLMSFGAFFFHDGHLEFSTLPADLHRDFHYRRLMLFTPESNLNVTVTVNAENKAVLSISAEADERVYACDGGCLDPPVPISGAPPAVFPVKLTDPPTAVLYVARTKQHLSELKHTLHVHEVAEAPAHEKHVIALHKHGHQLGGLPALFWATFAFLVVVFHLFLVRIIYNEYFAKGQYSTLDNNKKYVA